MVKCILSALILLFAISGICELIYFIKSYFMIPDAKFKTAAVVVLNPEGFVGQIKFLQSKYRWYGHSFANDVIFITDRLSDDEKDVCRQFSGSGYHFCAIEDLPHLINIIEAQDF